MSKSAEYFDALYALNPDPWGFATSDYERAKYDATLAVLPKDRFVSALEVGCSIGVFTQRLAQRSDRVLAVDLSATGLDLARQRCAGLDHVRFEQCAVPGQWPCGRHDLILLSEVLYFLDASDVRATALSAQDSLLPGGCIVLVNWQGETGTTLSGDAAAELFLRSITAPLRVTTRREPDYRLDLLSL